MPTKRRRIEHRRLRRAKELPASVQWWLDHGRSLGIAEARELDLGADAAWTISHLAFDRPVMQGWTRRELRALGFGARIDQLVALGACCPDRR